MWLNIGHSVCLTDWLGGKRFLSTSFNHSCVFMFTDDFISVLYDAMEIRHPMRNTWSIKIFFFSRKVRKTNKICWTCTNTSIFYCNFINQMILRSSPRLSLYNYWLRLAPGGLWKREHLIGAIDGWAKWQIDRTSIKYNSQINSIKTIISFGSIAFFPPTQEPERRLKKR